VGKDASDDEIFPITFQVVKIRLGAVPCAGADGMDQRVPEFIRSYVAFETLSVCVNRSLHLVSSSNSQDTGFSTSLSWVR
jgi:hypothetical protein